MKKEIKKELHWKWKAFSSGEIRYYVVPVNWQIC